MIENELKSLFIGNQYLKKEIASIINNQNISIVPEIQFINGITADFAIFDNKEKIQSIIECKGDNIGVTEYIRGVGQITQYNYFRENNVTKNIDKNCQVFLSFPSSLISDASFDITKIAYPLGTKLMIINSDNISLTIIDPNIEYSKIERSIDTIQICPYYFRDTRIAELYIILKELVFLYNNGNTIKRKDCESILEKYNTPNKNNSRNVFIALSSIGLINPKNEPTLKGCELSFLDYSEFATGILFDYYKPFINLIFRCFDYFQKKQDKYSIKNISNREIIGAIKEFYTGKDIYYLTESEGRYISSWLNSLRDDYQCIDFLPNRKSKDITIKYNPLYSKEHTKQYIKSHINIDYVNKYLSDLKNRN